MQAVTLPPGLRAVAILFIICGVLSAIDMVAALFNNGIKLNTGVLGIFVGFGLLALKPGWRTCALVLIWLGFLLAIIAGFMMAAEPRNTHVNFFGLSLGRAPAPVAWLFLLGSFALLLWQYKVLTRPDVRARFGLT